MGMAAQIDRYVTARPDSNVKDIQADRSEPIPFDSGAASTASGDATIINKARTVSALRELLRLEFAPGLDAQGLRKQARESAHGAIHLFDQMPFAAAHFWNWIRMAVAEWRNRARLRQDFAMLSDRELWDVSLTRADVMNESHRPFWKL